MHYFLVRNFVAEVTAKPRGINVTCKCKKSKFHTKTGHEGPEGSRSIAILFLYPWR